MFKLIATLFLVHLTISIDVADDPSLWPGHLEPFGSKQSTNSIEVLTAWPSPIEFFQDYVDKSRPALFKGLGKKSPAFQLWNDDYLKNHPGADSYLVAIEPEKKENRTKEGKNVTFKKFIEIYHKESVYMVHGVPKGIQKDVLIPPPLRCKETRRLLMDAVTWFSSGGTKSVVHYDDLDNVNCLFKGKKKLLFVNPKFVDFIPLEKGYSPIDVEKVDYIKFPNLRKVEYIRADMEEGDCLFIPYSWIHQVNSQANENGQNIAVNIWFQHKNNHKPRTCPINPEEATLDKYWFPELEKTQANFEDREYHIGFLELFSKFESYLQHTKNQKANFKLFYEILKQDEDMALGFTEGENDSSDGMEYPSDVSKLVKKLFDVLDITKNGVLSAKDFQYADNNGVSNEYETALTSAYKEVTDRILKFYEGNDDKEENKINDEL